MLPVLLAVALHAALGIWLQGLWVRSDAPERVFKPRIVNSTLLVLEPKPKPKPKAAAPPKPAPARSEPVRKPEPVVEATPRPDPALEAARERAAAEAREQDARKAREEAERQDRLAALANSSFLDALEDEAVDLAEDAAAQEQAAAQSFRYGIYQQIVANWSRPPSARNGMQARLQVDLVPTGDVVAVTLLESSGSAAFDQSAEAAVRKARRFEVPKEAAMFEKHFRRFTLLFRPEDLLR
jgi:colicin import membrane protein